MGERVFERPALHLRSEPVVLASVQETRGATPRKRGSRMLVTHDTIEFSIDGGLAEARVIEAVRATLRPTPRLQAPIGHDIGAHAPHEIAVSIIAQLIQARARSDTD